MTRNLFLLLLCVSPLFISAQKNTIVRLDNSKITEKDLDQKINNLIKAASVHGLAISIFNDNKPVYKKTFGYKDVPRKLPIAGSTNIYGASLSKAVFAVLVMKLVEEKILDLDKPLKDFLPKPIYEYKGTKKWHDNYEDLRTDTLHQRITARMCLAHTTGFPNWRWDLPGEKLQVTRAPGIRYGYSGEGLVFLQVHLEYMLGKTLEELMKEKVFIPAGMHNSSYNFLARFEADYALGHNEKGAPYEKDKDNEARSASTLETTIDDYSLFTKAVLNNTIISQKSRTEMFKPQIRIRSIAQFGPMRHRDSTFNDKIQLAYGLGWVLLQSPYGTGAFKEGHGDGFQHYSILFPDKKIGIVIMSNSDNAESIFKELLEITIGDVFTPWQWENYVPYNAK
ncbi:MAG: beta-lactamase family protein [Gemmatimonadaceae bacterium]|nr:beta-lactamase family protein [Chitinophagaceae bacterium]